MAHLKKLSEVTFLHRFHEQGHINFELKPNQSYPKNILYKPLSQQDQLNKGLADLKRSDFLLRSAQTLFAQYLDYAK